MDGRILAAGAGRRARGTGDLRNARRDVYARRTWHAAAQKLPHLRDVGVTLLELMPVAEFAGRFGWGYDGVNLFAPTRLYGSPDDFRLFIDRAHAIGLGVILDVVYNHHGPDGCYLTQFADHYFTKRHCTDWGAALNFDGEGSAAVREFYLANARAWIEEYHLDGYRFDATQAILDNSPEHILSAISRAARSAAGSKQIYLVNENEPQHTRLVQPVEQSGYGMDALWNDDFHHSAMVALTGIARPTTQITRVNRRSSYRRQNGVPVPGATVRLAK